MQPLILAVVMHSPSSELLVMYEKEIFIHKINFHTYRSSLDGRPALPPLFFIDFIGFFVFPLLMGLGSLSHYFLVGVSKFRY